MLYMWVDTRWRKCPRKHHWRSRTTPWIGGHSTPVLDTGVWFDTVDARVFDIVRNKNANAKALATTVW